MFQFHFKDVVFLEKVGAFIGLAAFLAALEVKGCFLGRSSQKEIYNLNRLTPYIYLQKHFVIFSGFSP